MDTIWLYQRDTTDSLISAAHDLLYCATFLETVLLQKAYSAVNPEGAFWPAQKVAETASQYISAAIDHLRFDSLFPQLASRHKLVTLLSRIGSPRTRVFSDASPNNPIDYWPQSPATVCREDMLLFYLLVKVAYRDIRTRLTNRDGEREFLEQIDEVAVHLMGVSVSTDARTFNEYEEHLVSYWASAG